MGKESYKMIRKLGSLIRHFLPQEKTAQEKLKEDHYLIDMDTLRKAVERVQVEDPEMNKDNLVAARWCQIGRWLDESTAAFPDKNDFEEILELKHAVNVISHLIDRHADACPVAIEKPLLWDISCRIGFLYSCENFHGKNVKPWRNSGNVAYIFPRSAEMRKHFEESRNYFDEQRDALRARKANSKDIAFLTKPNEAIFTYFRQQSQKTDYSPPVIHANGNPDMGYVCDTASAIRHFSVIITDYLRGHPEVEQDRVAAINEKATWEMQRNLSATPAKSLSAEIL